MITFIIGPNGSGKSALAEKIIEGLKKDARYYIATMIPYGEEGAARVQKHLKMREHLGMITKEDPYFQRLDEIPDEADVLLEDVSNLVANRIFGDEKELSADTVVSEIKALGQRVRNLVIVSIGGIVAEGYDEETTRYIEKLNEINMQLEELADKTIKM